MPTETTKNFRRKRLADPKKFQRFFTRKLKGGKRVIIGVKKSGKTEAQAVLTPRKHAEGTAPAVPAQASAKAPAQRPFFLRKPKPRSE